MTTTIEAIYERGVFRPIRQVELTEGTHVEVLIPTSESARDPQVVADRLSRIAARTQRGTQADTASKDHDRFLYGGATR